MAAIEGFVFDLHSFGEDIQLWLKTKNGKTIDLYDKFYPEIYVRGKKRATTAFLQQLVEKNALAKKIEICYKKDFYRNILLPFFKLTLNGSDVLREIRQKLFAFYGTTEIHHADFEVPFAYALQKGIFPLCRVTAIFDEKNRRLFSLKNHDNIDELEYEIPPLKVLRLKKEKAARIPLGTKNPLVYSFDTFGQEKDNLAEKMPSREERLLWEGPSALKKLNVILQEWDPDIILTTQGDLFLLPEIFALAKKSGINLFFDRPSLLKIVRHHRRGGKSFNSYGNIVFRALAWPLYGRWHIDSANSFLYKEADLVGIIELSRLSHLPVQRMARASTGLALTCLEIETALKMNYAVPWQKSEAENPKTLLELLRHDKGGLTFMPPHQTLISPAVQLDFAQMYPTIMVKHNISPETVNCSCCRQGGTKIPYTSYHICRQREGVVASALKKVLERRSYLKAKAASLGQNREIYDKRQSSLKWMLVTSFGYLGYRNAKFGKLESHEAVTAFGRDKLLKAKEIAEQMGFQVLHAMTDCLFLFLNDEEALKNLTPLLCQEVEKATGITLAAEAYYSWLCFPPSKQNPALKVPTRYFGRLMNGEMKYRGIALRRKDTPAFFAEFQEKILFLMQQCPTITEVRQREKDFWLIYEEAREELKSGQLSWQKLLFRRSVGKELSQYSVWGESRQVLEQLREEGFSVKPGEKIRYLVSHRGKKTLYLAEEKIALKEEVHVSREKYLEILHRTFCELCEPFFSCEHQQKLWAYP